jgi:hypothetical protein
VHFCVSFASEPPISELQAQIDRLNAALQRWQQAEGELQPLEDRLSSLTERGSEILNRLAAADERQAHAVSEVEARLSEWHATERRLHQDSLERMRTLERTIEQEWRALRGMHEEPLRLLREQAAALGETSVAAASLSLRGYERAEARLAQLESDLRAQITQLSRDIQTALADVKSAASAHAAALPPPAAAPFPLDRVMRIHDSLREGGGTSDTRGADAAAPAAGDAPAAGPRSGRPQTAPADIQPPPLQLSAATAALTERIEVLERELTQERQDNQDTAASTRKLRRASWVAAAAILVVLAGAGLLGLRIQQSMARAAARADAAERQAADADREIASARAETQAAREAAIRAELVSSVLSAPDLLRFSLAGIGASAGSRGQAMWSRSSGLVVSASTLPPPESGSEYHVWLRTPRQPVRAGRLTPDTNGRATLVTGTQDVPYPVDGVIVTLESTDAATDVPAGRLVLTRPPAYEP